MQLAYICAESGANDEQIYSVISDANERWGKYPKTRTDRHRRLVDIVERARAKHPVSLNNSFSGLIGSATKEGPTLLGAKSFMESDFSIAWHLEGLMSVGGFGLIVGSPGVGKTQLGIRMALAVSKGESFLHWENVTGPKKVVMLSCEMNGPSLKHLMSAMTDVDWEEHESNLIIYPSGEGLPFDTPEGRKYLESILKEQKPDVLFVDSLGQISSKSLSDDDSVRELTKYFAYLRRSYNLTFYTIHHNRKSQVKGQVGDTLDDTYGSRFLSSDPDFILNMTEKANVITLNVVKQRHGIKPPPQTIHRTPQLNFTLGDLNGTVQSDSSGGPGLFSGGLFGIGG